MSRLASFVLAASLLLAGCAGAAPATAARPAASGPGPEFPNVPDIPAPPGSSYGHYFEKHQPVRIVFGVSNPKSSLKESLTNAAYTIKYLEPRGIPYQIQIVLYSRAVQAADAFSDRYAGYGPLMEALHKKGVEFRVCNNSMFAVGVHAGDVYEYMKIIPAGILQIVKKEKQGYTYISNP